jgi:hypothetical protein
VDDLGAEMEQTIQDQQDQINTLETELANASANIAALEDELDSVGLAMLSFEERLDALALALTGTGLVLSTYEVNCNQLTIYNATGKNRCDLVTGVSDSDPPLVQIYNKRETGGDWTAQWECWASGSYCHNADRAFESQSPGMGIRYDSTLETIYAAPHYESTTDDARTIYKVVVVGNQAYTTP